jgi:DNA-binding response OmpR family regulator
VRSDLKHKGALFFFAPLRKELAHDDRFSRAWKPDSVNFSGALKAQQQTELIQKARLTLRINPQSRKGTVCFENSPGSSIQPSKLETAVLQALLTAYPEPLQQEQFLLAHPEYLENTFHASIRTLRSKLHQLSPELSLSPGQRVGSQTYYSLLIPGETPPPFYTEPKLALRLPPSHRSLLSPGGLSGQEYDLFVLMLRAKGRKLPVTKALNQVVIIDESNVFDRVVSQLRRKIEAKGPGVLLIRERKDIAPPGMLQLVIDPELIKSDS